MAKFEFLARKIQYSRWESKQFSDDEDYIRTDALTGRCIQTSNAALSVWSCENDETDVAEIVIALASKLDRIDKVEIIVVHKDVLEQKGFKFNDSLGDTAVKDLNSRHLDIIEINLYRIILLAAYFTSKVKADETYLFTKGRVLKMFRKAVDDNRVDIKKLKPSLIKDLNL